MPPGIRPTDKMLAKQYFEFEQGRLIDDFARRFPEMKGISSDGFCFFSSLYWLKSHARLRRHHVGVINRFEEISFAATAANRQLDDTKFAKVLDGQAAYGRRLDEWKSSLPQQLADFDIKSRIIQARAKVHLKPINERLWETERMMEVVGGTPSARTADALDIGNPQDYIARLEQKKSEVLEHAGRKIESAYKTMDAKRFRQIGNVNVDLPKIDTAEAMNIRFIGGKLVTRQPGFGAEIMGVISLGGYFIIDLGHAVQGGVTWSHAIGLQVTVGNLFRLAFFDPNLGVFTSGKRDVAEQLICELILSYIDTDDNSCLYDRIAVLQIAMG